VFLISYFALPSSAVLKPAQASLVYKQQFKQQLNNSLTTIEPTDVTIDPVTSQNILNIARQRIALPSAFMKAPQVRQSGKG
jgi:hypothetical protein